LELATFTLADLELSILLLPPPKYWGYRCLQPHPARSMALKRLSCVVVELVTAWKNSHEYMEILHDC
jgi:hypothetical protein